MMKTKLGKERNFIELSTWDFQVTSRIEPSVACLPSLHLGGRIMRTHARAFKMITKDVLKRKHILNDSLY